MALFPRLKIWTKEKLLAADLNAEFDNSNEKASDPAYIKGASASVPDMQTTADPGGVGTESLATNILGEIHRLRFLIKGIVGGAEWYTAPTKNINTVNTAISSSSGAHTMNLTSYDDVTNLSVSLTTLGRPVLLQLVHDESATLGQISGGRNTFASASLFSTRFRLAILRDSTIIAHFECGNIMSGPSMGLFNSYYPAGSFWHVDVPAAGTYTWKVQVLAEDSTATNVSVSNVKLRAIEL